MATIERLKQQGNGSVGDMIAVDNPATGEVIGHVPDMDASQVEALVARAGGAERREGDQPPAVGPDHPSVCGQRTEQGRIERHGDRRCV